MEGVKYFTGGVVHLCMLVIHGTLAWPGLQVSGSCVYIFATSCCCGVYFLGKSL